LGDELEARQYRREKRAKLDRQEFVDKTQIPKIRKEQHNRLAALWVKLGLCVVFSIALMWFENVAFFTDLFTGAPKQFAGVFDPAVYPVVYIMTSLQLMLFACLCAYEQIIDGFKYLFRGIPRAESLLSFLTVTGIVYSAVLARVIDTPNEPSMFNFVVALAAVLTLVYSIYNTKREKMNFEIVSSKKTKHIMRRLPDEESMSQAQAFMEQTDACDVMKIEKTDFIDGFFGRLYQPDSTVTIFMTCMMSVAAALAVLVGFFVNMKGGNSAEVLRAAYMTLLVSAPVFALVAFSYPFYRATKAANEYNSAIIGETALGEYSNASIISFDDKKITKTFAIS
jgi:cation transport ATPase